MLRRQGLDAPNLPGMTVVAKKTRMRPPADQPQAYSPYATAVPAVLKSLAPKRLTQPWHDCPLFAAGRRIIRAITRTTATDLPRPQKRYDRQRADFAGKLCPSLRDRRDKLSFHERVTSGG